MEHLFIASTHDYLLFFTDRGKVFWQKVYDLPLLSRTSKGRALVNMVQLQEGEKIFNCLAVREFDEVRQLLMATRSGIVKKTPLSAYSRPQKGGIIAIKLDEGDELIDVVIVSPKDDVLLATANGMSIRFAQSDARSMGRNTRGVKGIKLKKGDQVVGMVVAHPEMDLLSVSEKGYGKRTPFGAMEEVPEAAIPESEGQGTEPPADEAEPEEELEAPVAEAEEAEGEEEAAEGDEDALRSNLSYRRQRRGGMGIRSMRTSERNGPVVDVIAVSEEDEVLMVTAGGKIQRVRAREIRQIGRNTQGVTIIRLEEGDSLVSLARVPSEEIKAAEVHKPSAALPPPVLPETVVDETEERPDEE
jgi:DNA gyrase subunit A